MPIPSFTAEGLLPEGIYEATIEEIEKAFGTATPVRKELMANLMKVLRNFKDAGIRKVWLNGSFVSNKVSLNCVDGVWEYCTGVNLAILERIFLGNSKMMKKKYKVHFVINTNIFADRGGLSVFEYFQQIKYTEKKRGIVQINLDEEKSL